ncbi:MAG: Repeat family protein, partial [Chthoniobacteraceae bacterium]|nr:Repeat family protein [Chthoniobacteraceae bacterium]
MRARTFLNGAWSVSTSARYNVVGQAVARGNSSLVLRTDGMVLGWGNNAAGQLALGYKEPKIPAVAYAPLLNGITALSMGSTHAIALQDDGTVLAWGSNARGQMGRGTTDAEQLLPIRVEQLTDIVAVAAGDTHNLALDASGRVWTWGDNTYGQLGNGSVGGLSNLPVLIPGLANVVAIASGAKHSLALTMDGSVYAWGVNADGQLGTGSINTESKPALVAWQGASSGMPRMTRIAAGAEHSMALGSDGSLWLWGSNIYGQLGTGNSIGITSPYKATAIPAQIVEIAAGGKHSLALAADGTVFSWGWDVSGQLGDDPLCVQKLSPVPVSGLTGVSSISAGALHNLAIVNGELWTWGDNGSGQMADSNTFPYRALPYKIAGMQIVEALLDEDGDGLQNWQERDAGTDTHLADSDFDDVGDGYEIAHGTDPLVSQKPETDDLWPVFESDGATNKSATPAAPAVEVLEKTVVADTAVGTTNGKFAVGAAGDATYSLPIAIPPGTGGMEPKLSVDYSSQSGNGLLGAGWSLNGLSSITRHGTTLGEDGYIQGTLFNDKDGFSFDGQRLVVVQGTNGAANSEYRTKMESQVKVQAFGVIGNGPEYFKVWTKSGLIIELGKNPDARLLASGNRGVIAWKVSGIQDTKGNYLTVSYTDLLPTRINYTGNASQGIYPYASVRFTYKSRNDSTFSYLSGTRINLDQYLSKIEAFYQETLVKSYVFQYAVSPITRRLRLTDVQEVGLPNASGQREAFRPTSFKYQQEGTLDSPWATTPEMRSPVDFTDLRADNLQDAGVVFADLNGDGRTDMLCASNMSGTVVRRAYLNDGTKWVSTPKLAPPQNLVERVENRVHSVNSSLVLPASSMDMGVRIIDLNGDGRADFVYSRTGDKGTASATFLSTGTGWVKNNGYRLPMPTVDIQQVTTRNSEGAVDTINWSTKELGAVFADLNGDGLPDFLVSRLENGETVSRAFLNTGRGWKENNGYRSPIPLSTVTGNNSKDMGVRVMDINGDGLADLVGGGASPVTYLNTGTGWASNAAYKLPISLTDAVTGQDYGARLIDINGDGLTDLVQGYLKEGVPAVCNTYLNTGTGWAGNAAYALPKPLVYIDSKGRSVDLGVRFMDLDGDGLLDMAYGNQMESVNTTGAFHNTGTRLVPSDVLRFNHVFNAVVKTPAGSYGTLRVDVNGDGHADKVDLKYDGSIANQDQGIREVDVNGDGLSDLLVSRINQNGDRVRGALVNRFEGADRLCGVTNGFGVKLGINYTHMTDGLRYYKEATAVYPTIDIQDSTALVSSYDEDDGVGSFGRTECVYAGYKTNLQGRGAHGFHWIQTVDTQTKIKNRTTYLQRYPFEGSPEIVEMFLDNTVLKSVVSVWDYRTIGSGLGTRYLPFTSYVKTDDFDLDGSSKGSATSSSQYDDYGNLTYSVVDSGDGYIKTLESQYDNDPVAWRVGRLTYSKMTHEAPNVPTIVKQSGFRYKPSTGVLDKETVEPQDAAVASSTEYDYDGFGNVRLATQSGDAENPARIAITRYDAYGRFALESENAYGHIAKKEIDQARGMPMASVDINNLRSTYKYDGFNRLTETTGPDLNTTGMQMSFVSTAEQTALPLACYKTETRTATLPSTIVYYDKLGRAICSQGTGWNSQIVSQETEYNALGQVWRASQRHFASEPAADRKWTKVEYDAVGRALKQTEADNSITAWTYLGRTVKTTNARTYYSIAESNPNGQLIRVTDPLTGVIRYNYDAVGRLSETITQEGAPLTRVDLVTKFFYDSLGRKTSMIDPDMGTWEYHYNAFSELKWQKDAKLQITTFQYDLLGRKIAQLTPESATPIQWFYDKDANGAGRLGVLRKVVHHTGLTDDFTYDSLGRLFSSTRVMQSGSFTSKTTYDSLNRPETSEYPSGLKTRNIYSSLGYLASVSNFSSGVVYSEVLEMDAQG